MKKGLLLASALLIVAAASTSASAQVTLHFSKTTFEAEVGSVDFASVALSTGSNVTILDELSISGGEGAFTLVGAPSTEQISGSTTFGIEFSPPAAGTYSASLILRYRYLAFVGFSLITYTVDQSFSLHGTGIAPISPEELIAGLIAYYDQGLSDGTIYGLGRGRSAPNKARALGRQLDSARRMIESGDWDRAIEQLEDVLKHADGANRPPDFIAGVGLSEFQTLIMDLIDVLSA